MLNRWRLLLAGLLAFVALASGLALAFFPFQSAWNCCSVLFCWSRRSLLRGACTAGARSASSSFPTSQTPTTPTPCLVAVAPFVWPSGRSAIGVCAWVWVNDQGPDKPPLGLALLLGTALAVVLTAVPFIIKDLIAGQWRLWSSTWRNRKHRTDTIS